MARLFHPLAEGLEGIAARGFGRGEPSVEHEVWKFAFLLETAQNGTDLADHQFEHRNLVIKQREQLFLEGAAGDEIEHEHFAGLPDPVDTADALFNRHRIPRQVEIDQSVAELDIASFAARLRAKQNICLITKSRDGCVLFGPAHAPVEARERHTGLLEAPRNMSERFARMHENNFFLLRIAPDEINE